MQYHHFQNYTKITCYAYYDIHKGKEMYLIFVFAKCCWSDHSKVVRFGKHVHSTQCKATTAQSLQFYGKFTCMPC